MPMTAADPGHSVPKTDLGLGSGTPPRHDALKLTGGGATAQICLHDQCYTLRITRQGKLILTK